MYANGNRDEDFNILTTIIVMIRPPPPIKLLIMPYT